MGMLEATKKQRNDKFLAAIEPYRNGIVINMKRSQIAEMLGISLSAVDRKLKNNGYKPMPRGSTGTRRSVIARREKIKDLMEKKPEYTLDDLTKHIPASKEVIRSDLHAIGLKPAKKKHELTPKEKKQLRQIDKMLEYYTDHDGEGSIKAALLKFELSQNCWAKWRVEYFERDEYRTFIRKNSAVSEQNGMKKRVTDLLANTNLTFRQIAGVADCSYSYVCRLNQLSNIRQGGYYTKRKKKEGENENGIIV